MDKKNMFSLEGEDRSHNRRRPRNRLAIVRAMQKQEQPLYLTAAMRRP